MYCKNCGKLIDDNCYYCDGCGAAVEKNTNWSGYSNNAYQNPYANQANNFDVYNNYRSAEIDKKIEDGRTLGILAIILGLLVSSVVGLILGIVGMEKLKDINFDMNYPQTNKYNEAKNLNKWGIIIPIIRFLLVIVIFILYLAFIVGITAGAY